jgi:hypothetical protein
VCDEVVDPSDRCGLWSERAIVCEDQEEVEDSWEPPSIGKEASESVLACEAAD